MPLEVIGAGFGRTGTLSLKTALEELGFGPCHHMTEIIKDMWRQGRIWNRVVAGNERDWDHVFAGYRATVDWPSCNYYAELAEAYPQAKVILTVRDSEKWYASMTETIFRMQQRLILRVLMKIPGLPIRFAQTVFDQTFNFDTGRDNAIATFERHNAEVRQRIPAERLLVFEVAQGWEPLCAFLGVPVPDRPFPRVNDREEFQRLPQTVRKQKG